MCRISLEYLAIIVLSTAGVYSTAVPVLLVVDNCSHHKFDITSRCECECACYYVLHTCVAELPSSSKCVG